MTVEEITRRVPAGAWRDGASVAVLAARGFFRDNCPSWAAAIAYYSLLSLFPLLLAAGSIASFFVEPAWAVQQATGYLGELLPGGPAAIEQIVKQSLRAGRGPGLLFILPLFWTGSLVFNVVTKALNIAFETEERYGFWKRTLIRFGMLLSLGFMFVVALASSSVLRLLHRGMGVPPGARAVVLGLLVHVLPAMFILIAFVLSYRLIPRRRPHWRAALAGAAVATLLFAAAKPLFLGYVRDMARYNIIYGSLAGIIVVVLWSWVVAMIGLFGGEIASNTQAIFIDNRAPNRVERRERAQPL